jgi:hypothetical protein
MKAIPEKWDFMERSVRESSDHVNTMLRNGKNIISNIHFGNDFIATAEDNTENKNHEIVSSLFLRNNKYII